MENTKIKIAAQTYNLWRTPLNVLGKLQVIKTLGYDSAELAGCPDFGPVWPEAA